MIDYKSLKETLEKRIKECDKVFIAPHKRADFDAIASSIGLTLIANKLNKPSYIIIGNEEEPGVKKIINETKDRCKYITLDKYLKLKGDNDLLITTDVNKTYMVEVSDYLADFKEKVIIDHHNTDDKTIKTNEEDIFVDTEKSSASEILYEVLNLYEKDNEDTNQIIDHDIAVYLMTGIYLDTSKLNKNVSPRTMEIIFEFYQRGVTINETNRYFLTDLQSDQKYLKVLENARFITSILGIAVSDGVHLKEDIAKAADTLLQYANASVVAGYIDENGTIAVSARSDGSIDVGTLMQKLNGGGNTCSGATVINDEEMEEVQKKLIKVFKPYNQGNDQEKSK